jgi:hypothetical protein
MFILREVCVVAIRHGPAWGSCVVSGAAERPLSEGSSSAATAA